MLRAADDALAYLEQHRSEIPGVRLCNLQQQ